MLAAIIMTQSKIISAFLTVFFLGCNTVKQSANDVHNITTKEVSIGPEKGHLVLAGGGWEDSTALKKFVSIAGKDSKILIIPTATIEDERDSALQPFYSDLKKNFRAAGASNLEIIHTKDTSIANSQPFLSKIKEANAIWFTGGNVRNITDAYLHTKVMDELNNLLNRNGVIGGNSAGANAMGTYFFKLDTSTTKTAFEKNNNGFNFIKNTCIFPHLLRWNRQFLFFDFKKNYKDDLLGIGIDAKTAVIIHKNELEVIGSSCVAIYDGTFQSDRQKKSFEKLPANSERFYILYAGAKYDLSKRKAIQFFNQ